MLAAGGYSWNAGIFLFRAARMRDAMLTHCRPIFEAADRALAAGMRDGDALYADAIAFAKAPSDSIDYAVLEKADRVADRQSVVVGKRVSGRVDTGGRRMQKKKK